MKRRPRDPFRSLLFALIALLLLSGQAFGQEFYNDGANVYVQVGGLIHVQGNVTNDDQGANLGRIFNSGDVQLEGDWSNTSATNVFQNGDPGTTTFLGNNAVQLIQGTTDTYFNNLRLNKPGGTREVRMNRPSLCDGVLALNDDFLNTQTFIFGVANPLPAAITRAGGNTPNYMPSVVEGYVTSTVGSNGRLSRATLPGGTYLFPTGTAARWRPVEITPTTGGPNAYSVQFVDQPTPNTNQRAATLATINPAWYHFIERQLPSGSPESIRIYHDFVSDDICDIANVTLSQYNGSIWDDLSVTTSQNPAPFMSWTQKSDYPGAYPTPFATNQFALAGRFLAFNVSSCVFPVELLYLAAEPTENTIMLDWETASEMNNAGFELQRSTDGVEFKAIGWVEGSGNSQTNVSYSFEDVNVQPSLRYFYRLRQIDLNGTEKYSSIVDAILLKGLDHALGGFYPNPNKGQASLWLSLSSPSKLDVQVYNSLGQIVRMEQHQVAEGYHVLDFDFKELAAGVYIAKLQVNGEQLTKRLVIED